MGMFDQVHYNGRVFQTKDFECLMTDYYIENGRLLGSVGHAEDRSPATAWRTAHPGEELPEELQGLRGLCGCCSWVETGRKDTNFHGILRFYTCTSPDDWEEYKAKFTDGALVEVSRVETEPKLARDEGQSSAAAEHRTQASDTQKKP